MIILVKVNKSYIPGSDPRIAAYRSWVIGSLLDNAKLRNQYKFLVALYKGQIVGTFCIHGVALDVPYSGNRRKVKFLLKDTDYECDTSLRRIISALIASGSQKIRRAISFCLIDINYLIKNEIQPESINCKCEMDQIPVLDSQEIIIDETRAGDDYVKHPTEEWLKLSSMRNTFESFRDPHTLQTRTIIIYHPSGNIDFQKWADSSGEWAEIKNTIDAKESDTIKFILSTFHANPNNAVQLINKSHIVILQHYNNFEIEFEAFEDRNMKIRTQQIKWERNVGFCDSGFLKTIMEIVT